MANAATPETVYTWSVNSMDIYPEKDGFTDFVCTVHWNCSGTKGTATGSLNGATGFAPKSDANYDDYSSLTQEQVIGWVQAQMGADAVADVLKDIDSQIAQTAAVAPLPW